MQSQKRNEKSQGNHDEKRQTGYPRCMPNLRHQDVQDRQKLKGSLLAFCVPPQRGAQKVFPILSA
jgi:hypothetical protein